MDFLSMQFMARFGHLLVWHASIVSGAYKQRKMFHGTISSNGPELTDEEKLQDSMDTLRRYSELLDEICDYRGTHSGDAKGGE